ncbi:hypothetical protein BYT27DRAFT_7263287 [Phlegmacium glaucopus]|nr:hypothetical protein BYT27DRAFT_7263287 [Phlegmacium glaucopus]
MPPPCEYTANLMDPSYGRGVMAVFLMSQTLHGMVMVAVTYSRMPIVATIIPQE